MTFPQLFLNTGMLVFAGMTGLWLISLLLKNAAIVDVFWGIGFILITWMAFCLSTEGYLPRKILICSLTTLWGVRLALHIGRRNWGKPEDFRYAAWREGHGRNWWWISYFQVFLLQGGVMWLLSMPIVAAQTAGLPAIPTPLDLSGASVWAFGWMYESIADLQLERFKRENKNRAALLTSGLWRTSRHPNYFGEAVVWWGIYLIALSAGAWWTILSPILMTWLLVRVSGAALLERTLRQKPGYEEYIRTTSGFVPWLRKQ